jgi:endonuclease-3
MSINFKEILDKVGKELEGQAHLGELEKRGSNPFKILIATILSARTRDTTTSKITDELFEIYNTPQAIAEADLEDLKVIIRSIGFYKVKAARIKEISEIIWKDYNSEVPKDFDELVNLPGVGPKTANCVLVFAFQIPAITVDIHIHRIPNRLGWIKTKTPKQSEAALKKILPKKHWLRFSRLFVKFGQTICIPVHPKCNTCPIEDKCVKDFTMEKEMRRKRKEAAKRKAAREKAAKEKAAAEKKNKK